MNERVRVPIRVRRSSDGSQQEVREEKKAVVDSEPPVVEQRRVVQEGAVGVAPAQPRAESVPPLPRREKQEERQQEIETLREELETWRDRALRLQAEIENFRKRQRRLAEETIQTDRARLLRNFLMIADDLERALRAEGEQESLREGVEVTYRSLKQLLKQEGVERIEAQGETFDPEWHEAVGTVPHQQADANRDTVVEVTQQGYRLDGRLLRPARVIVAK
ncbi:MAG: nucleotide exchange factor GrpE [Chloroflexota bacterium]|nr:nucleotide exchange factor GrpE [Chloroflexota bacterium]